MHRLLPALLILLLTPAAHAADPSLDSLLTDALKTWQIPGLAVAVVRGDEVIYLQGHGVREKGRPEQVTPDTVFGIGSLTKAFTATALAQLVNDGKVKWDDPVRKHIPSFRLKDPLADRDVTLRDLLCHRTGLPREDLLWYRAPWSLDETIRRAAFLEPASSFRSAFGYNNIAYIAAGAAITSASGRPWNDFVKRRLLDPLEMKSVAFTRSEFLKLPDHASPHHKENGTFKVIDCYDDDKQVRASGSLKVSARGLANWMRMQLADGVFQGNQLVSAAALAETPRGQIPIRPDADDDERDRAATTGATQTSYGLGWRILDYRGHPLHEHGGAVDGFRARILLLPKDQLGVVLLTNGDETEAVLATANLLLDHLLKLDKKDWNAHYLQRAKEREDRRQTEAKAFAATRQPGTKPSLDLAAYVGTYEDAAYGTLTIGKDDKGLTLAWSSYRVPLQHVHFDTFALQQNQDTLGRTARFVLDADAKPTTLRALGRTFVRR